MSDVVHDEPVQKGNQLTGVVIEAAHPLSQSRLWQINQDYFREMGIRAWSSGEVPYQMTTGALMARAYSRLVTAFLDDCLAGRVGTLDPREPVYIIELAAGSGRLGFEFLSVFDASRFAPLRVVYVLTDLAESNIKSFSEHERLQPFFNDGRADFARYEIGGDASLHLVRSGIDLFASTPVNPTICIANYAFSDLPQDLYAVVDSVLYQELVELSALETGPESTPANFFGSLFVATERVPVSPTEMGGGLLGSTLSAEAAAASDIDHRFLLPTAVLRSIEEFLHLSGERLLLLVSDRFADLPQGTSDRAAMDAFIAAMPVVPDGFVPTISINGNEKYRPAILGMGVHGGCFSLPFDMGIVERALEPFGFTMLPSVYLPTLIRVSVCANEKQTQLLQLRQAHTEALGDLSPENLLLALGASTNGANDGLTLSHFLSMLRVSGYDSGLLRECRIALEPVLRGAAPVLVDEAERVFNKVFDHHFPLLKEDDLAWDIAILLGVAGRYESALKYHEQSLIVSGPNPERFWRIAECHFLLGEKTQALKWIDQCLEMQPDYEPAQVLKAQI